MRSSSMQCSDSRKAFHSTHPAGLRTASKGSSPPEQNQTRACGASSSARASKSHQTTTDGAQIKSNEIGLMPNCGLPSELPGLQLLKQFVLFAIVIFSVR
uniref:SFRICE_038152 n=1 Tax=Spodoptera frugiperda TaxID=7108 RepID=A0A2H1W0U3_SPOFR